MNNLNQKLTEDMKVAMKSGNSQTLSTIKLLLSAIHNKEIEKRTRLSKKTADLQELERTCRLTDEEIFEVISNEIKKHKDSITAYLAVRPDLAEQEKKELEVLKKYAPKELSEEEIRAIIKAKITEIGASSIKDLGKVMGKAAQETKGRADGALVKKIVEEELEK